jgi:hypothetical protein
MDAHLHGAQANFEHPRDLFIRETLDISENDNAPHVGAESHHRSIQAAAQVPPLQGLCRIRISGVHIFRTGIFDFGRQDFSGGGPALLFFQGIKASINSDAMNPGRQRRRFVQLSNPTIHFEKNFLGLILGLVPITHQAVSSGKHSPLVLLDEKLKSA